MIKINHELPESLLKYSIEFNDYEFVLPHLLDKSPGYKKFMLEAKEKGRYIIMDNSLHELGEAYNWDRLKFWVNELKPNEFIVPDVWENKNETLRNAKYFKQFQYPKETKLVAVIQGKNIGEITESYVILKDLGYEKIAFSYGASFYERLVEHSNPFVSKALGRVTLIHSLLKRGIMSNKDKIHLLGCSLPQEFIYYKDLKIIESLDTSNPVMAALDGVKYESYGLLEKPKSNLNNSFDKIDNLDIELLKYNTTKFKEINGLL